MTNDTDIALPSIAPPFGVLPFIILSPNENIYHWTMLKQQATVRWARENASSAWFACVRVRFYSIRNRTNRLNYSCSRIKRDTFMFRRWLLSVPDFICTAHVACEAYSNNKGAHSWRCPFPANEISPKSLFLPTHTHRRAHLANTSSNSRQHRRDGFCVFVEKLNKI